MSFSKLVQPLSADMIAAMGNVYADFEKTHGSSTSKTSNNKQQLNFPIHEYKNLDGSDFVVKTEMEEFEASLFAQYMSQPNEKKDHCGADGEKSDIDDDKNDDIIAPSSCMPCGPTATTSKQFKSSDSDLKNYALNLPRSMMAKCNSECKFGGKCVDRTTIEDMESMLFDFWDDVECPAPFAATRRLKIIQILRSAYRSHEREFHFYAGCKDHNNRRICEAAYLVLLGISNSPNASKAPGQWLRAKKFVAEGKDISGIRYRWNESEEEELLKAEHKQTKSDSAKDFILYFSKEFGDTIPGSEGIYVLCCIYINENYVYILTQLRCLSNI